MEIDELKRRAGITEAQLSHWDEHPNYAVSDWQYEVAADDTRLGYWEWVKAGLINDGDPSGSTIQIPTSGQ
jgi:hypothetical protein